MKKRVKPLNGYLCPICVVKIPYLDKFSEHWKRFHGRRYETRFKSSPPFNDYWSRQEHCNKKTHLDFKIGHEFRTYILGRHDPRLCQFCKHIVWKYAKCCLDCGYTCHVECQHLVASHCRDNMNQQDCPAADNIVKRYSLGSLPPGTTRCELDLTYINDRLIAVSFPSFGLDEVYRRGISELMEMLQSRYTERYQIINVSERRYDMLQVTEKGQLLNYGWPDHLAPPLHTLHQIIKSLHLWLLADLKNVAVLHCKGGTSRIGMVIASYIQYTKNTPNPQRALEWFALKHYYDTKLEGAALPFQKRYIHYFGNIFEKKLKVTNRRLYFENIIVHGVPYCGNGTGMCFYLKIYQSYHLCYTTKKYAILPDSDRFTITIDGVLLQGDIMIKCLYQRDSVHKIIFRLQFRTDAIDGCVAVFGKYDLDEADKGDHFPDNCYIELLFSPTDEQSDENEVNEMTHLPNRGLLDMERHANGTEDSNGGGLVHVPGPIDGKPYAKIDFKLKDKCRPKPPMKDTPCGLTPGIEDLDDLLGDLGHVGTTISDTKTSDETQPCTENKISSSTLCENNSHYAPESKGSFVTNGEPGLEGESYAAFPTCHGGTNNNNDSPTSNDVSPLTNDGMFTESPTVNELLLDEPLTPHITNYYKNTPDTFTYDTMDDSFDSTSSVLESPRVNEFVLDEPSTRIKSFDRNTSNTSAYDTMEESFDSWSSDVDSSDFGRRFKNLEAALEIHPGTVARYVKQLQSKINASKNNKENAPKHGVPLAGIVSPTAIDTGQQYPSSYGNGAAPTVYQQNGVIQKNVEIDVSHQGHQYEPKVPSPCYTSYDDLRSTDDCDCSEIRNFFSKRSTLLARSDSAYGESMRSSSSSPSLTDPPTPRIDNSFVYDGGRKGTCIGESYSPKSDGVNDISSGIASRSSSMTSLSLDSGADDNKPTDGKLSTNVWRRQLSPRTKNVYGSRSCSVDTIDGSTQTSPTPGVPPPYAIENEIRATQISEDHQLNSRSIEMTPPVMIRKDNCSSPRGILKTMNVSDRHLDNDDIFMKGYDHQLNYSKGIEMKSPIMITTDNYSTRSGILKTIDVGDRKHLNNGDVFMKGNFPLQSQSSQNHIFPPLSEWSMASLGSSSDDFGVHIVDHQPSYHNERKLSVGSSTGSDGAYVPRLAASASEPIGKQTMSRSIRSRGGSASSQSAISLTELFHDIVRTPARNPYVTFDKETMSLWYKPKMSREEATTLLRDKEPGSFIVRDSQSCEGGFGLAMKVETPSPNVLQQVEGYVCKLDCSDGLVKHYLIEPCTQGVRLKGSTDERAFPSLMALIYQHSLMKMSLPNELIIPVPADDDDELRRTLSEAELLEKGACCNLVYLGAVDVESLTGDGAIHCAIDKVTSQSMQENTTTVNIKVNRKGITLTDNQRRLFFRRHYNMTDVLHCGVDPRRRKINLTTLVDNCNREVECFGFVVKKETQSLIRLPGNECHVCAEMDPNQPSSAVIDFIHKAMRYSEG